METSMNIREGTVDGSTFTPICVFILVQFASKTQKIRKYIFSTGIQNGQFKLGELPVTHLPVYQ